MRWVHQFCTHTTVTTVYDSYDSYDSHDWNLIPVAEFFMKAEEFVGLFSKYDDTGFPTHDKAGEPVTKSGSKKLKKELDKHKKTQKNTAK